MAEKPAVEILFEMVRRGNLVKVTAVDASSGTEVVIQGPASAGDAVLQQNAARKLLYVLEKQKNARK